MSLGGVQQLSRVCGTKPDLCVVACERGLPPSRLWYRCRIWHIPCPINSKIAEYLFILSFPLICLLISVLLSVWYTHFFVGDALYSSASLVVTLQVYMRVGGRVLHFARPTGKRSGRTAGGRVASVGCAISATPRRTWAITRRREQSSLLIQQHTCWNAGFWYRYKINSNCGPMSTRLLY